VAEKQEAAIISAASCCRHRRRPFRDGDRLWRARSRRSPNRFRPRCPQRALHCRRRDSRGRRQHPL